MRKRVDLSSGWKSYELVLPDANGELTVAPFAKALKTSGVDPVQAKNKMSLLEEIGWPKARRDMRYGRRNRARVVKKDDAVFLLKCTPHCARLYFYVDTKRKFVVYLHAVCKDQDEENRADAVIARAYYDRRAEGALSPIEFGY